MQLAQKLERLALAAALLKAVDDEKDVWLHYMSPLNESQAQENQLASPKEVHAAADYDRGLREDLRLCHDKTSLLLSCRARDSPGPGVAKRLSAGDASGLHRRPIPVDFAVPLIFPQ